MKFVKLSYLTLHQVGFAMIPNKLRFSYETFNIAAEAVGSYPAFSPFLSKSQFLTF
jgi:hypothetical protein